MTILNFISMGGGVALFLYGMTVMGNGLEKLSGGKMEKALEKLTGNILSSVLLGAVVTAVLQSSSATTVIIVGLVNAGMLQLRQAIGVIMGANIGTTITAQLIRLSDIDGGSLMLKFFKPANLAPLAAFIGILLYMMSHKARRKEIGQMLIGFGILFSGMFAMEAAVEPLKESPLFMELMAAMSNPLLGVLTGAVVTAAIQSSSASVGMLQAIASTGVIPFSAAFPIIMGQNIGTCITPILSSIGASKNAKRSAAVHLYFNIIGTTLFLVGAYGFIAVCGAPQFWFENVSRTSIANFHTLFNVVVTAALIPFAGLLEKLACATVKSSSHSDEERIFDLIDERLMVSPSLALQQSQHLITEMANLSLKNYYDSMELVAKFDSKTLERINETEKIVDKIEDKLENYLIKLSAEPMSPEESRMISVHLHLLKDYERISDYCTNLAECAQDLVANEVVFSDVAVNELDILLNAVHEIIEIANRAQSDMSEAAAREIEPLEETIDEIVRILKDTHVERLKNGQCSINAGISFHEILTNLERIADHCSNIGMEIIGCGESIGAHYESHEYARHIHEATEANYAFAYETYSAKYLKPIEDMKN
ncbi:MAG: Na/Pi cotransporter family protein, partial [Oscillospiraceae bacterium]|nr:Na/Pi cotransporter family protein [Oscillospiraceae bacterium]